jgi:lysophospholipase L1-like esterase
MREMLWIMVGWLTLLASGTGHLYAATPPFVYVALGASDATGVGAGSMAEGYVNLIKQELENLMPRVILINRGVSGARIDIVKEEVRRVKEGHNSADLVTIWVGANDLIHGDDPEVFREGLHFILQTLRQHVSHTIVIANLPNLTQLPRFRNQPSPHVTEKRIKAYNAVIAKEAGDVDAALVDLFAQSLRDDLVLHSDGFHPNDTGHREIAALFLNAIRPKIHASIGFELIANCQGADDARATRKDEGQPVPFGKRENSCLEIHPLTHQVGIHLLSDGGSAPSCTRLRRFLFRTRTAMGRATCPA